MTLQKIRPILFPLIKVISIGAISGAIGLEIWHLYASSIQTEIPGSIWPFLWFAHFAIVAHALEGAIAIRYAGSRNESPLQYGAYTFWVGTIGLIELFDHSHD
ncbi:hypothetical protein BST81_06740 [Leptolyngbya sp. 'hensonii']|nr:hypothetical protein BST81_06740 [Leptolyngbya sp. 'hensonii']